MKLYKKSQSIARHTILLWIIVLAVMIAVILIIDQARDKMLELISKIFS